MTRRDNETSNTRDTSPSAQTVGEELAQRIAGEAKKVLPKGQLWFEAIKLLNADPELRAKFFASMSQQQAVVKSQRNRVRAVLMTIGTLVGILGAFFALIGAPTLVVTIFLLICLIGIVVAGYTIEQRITREPASELSKSPANQSPVSKDLISSANSVREGLVKAVGGRLAYKWQVALITALGLFMAVLDNTIVSVALPQMADNFKIDFGTITWVATAYFLAQAAVIPVTGYLSDRIGSKTTFLAALALFTVGSALCAISPSHTLLIAFRVLQGIGGGALFPTAFAIIYRVFPPAERGPASAVIGVPILLAPAFGPTLGGYLTTTFDWHAIFTINIPIGIIAFTLAAIFLRGRAADRAAMGGEIGASQRFDLLGLVLAMGGFTTLVYGITEAGTQGWGDRTVDIYLAIGAVLLIAFVIVELRSSDPVMDMRLFKNYTFTISNVLMWALGAFLFGSLFLLPYFFEQVQGLTPLSAGEILISQGLAAAVSTVVAGSLYNRVGPRIMAFVGFILVTAGTWGFAHLDVTTTGASLQIWLILRGLGLGFINIPLQTLALSVVSNRAMARASSLVNVTRQVASALGVAALTSFLTQSATAHNNAITQSLNHIPPSGVAALCIKEAGVTNPTPPNLVVHMDAIKACTLQHATTLGLNDTFMFVLIACGICALLALLVGRDPAVQAAKEAKARGDEVTTSERAISGASSLI